MQPCKESIGDVKHLVGTSFVPSVVAYIQEMTGISRVEKLRPTREARFCEVEYEVKDGIIVNIYVARHANPHRVWIAPAERE
ncbi:hypothetical protein [Pseudomonas cremoricolorata]|uniref:hypothetical protein n=1 Tax=Pseudomonas cremoricolorata TaxID=157783 RepID=UPI00041A89A7|nr:hypothetical protein [Pseudomonas cremoricolorata]